ncbi:NAD-dependent epimerase/dehydratase family protein [Ureibacillus sp. FSL K6-8385]|uniref:NAD-dependent epimerase/dehydratase family protein n=1 Tax=Ureibacillus terrenus TaxID=118246 RepID=A0A540V234_9BACL|nr:NAD-dependent epimerase/dehydratase family protein [Ureibacillus terrenus]MED3661300.1 NAD-dependent epimerase/dehydratase family protein [Ureibacillus terrenus]MED3764228.1 NAD-dependent epimerase/dehydratase family protein [Ureibacillus terrenus]TQE90822.1 NAD-dependent epimerase/dehydratase family protein [Ureibacillus terrenus]
MKRIIVTGALGQIGSELVRKLRIEYGKDNVLATDIREDKNHDGPFEVLDVLDALKMYEVAKKFKADTMIHLAALLSATAEIKPILAWELNMGGLLNALEVSKELNMQLFNPSSIAVFGPSTPKNDTPQETLQRPTTMYGVNKVAGELLCDYYHLRYGVDVRGLRFPGLISPGTPPGGGTTDYAVEIYHKAVNEGSYTSYIAEGTYMDMMYMPDALNAIVELMEADPAKLTVRNAYNVSAMSFDPSEIAAEIKKHIPHFEIKYDVDPVRQSIAESWPNNIDSSRAVADWGFNPKYDLKAMTIDMLDKIGGGIKSRTPL